jgi:ubiquinone/menaquinone biosynthesis C-methylase UbiE
MNRFAERSERKELIDAPGIPFSDWETCLNELDKVNTLLGGHSITLKGVQNLLPASISSVSIAEIGCGGGDNLKAINNWNRKNQIPIHYTGIDINKACTDFAERNCSGIENVDFICSDFRDVDFKNSQPDIIFSSLFCHHFTDEQLIEMLVWLKKNSRLGFFINDLQRHPFAYHSIKILTKLFSKSYLVKNDGPVSVLRGFRKEEWEELLRKAGIGNYSIKWKWAFRYLVTVSNE